MEEEVTAKTIKAIRVEERLLITAEVYDPRKFVLFQWSALLNGVQSLFVTCPVARVTQVVFFFFGLYGFPLSADYTTFSKEGAPPPSQLVRMFRKVLE